MNQQEILKTIHRRVDVSGVRADVSLQELDQIVKAAKHYQFICAFAMPCFTARLVEMLKDEPDIRVGATVGFPSGADTTFIKVQSAKEQIAMGVDELDMVINVGAAKSGRFDLVEEDIPRRGRSSRRQIPRKEHPGDRLFDRRRDPPRERSRPCGRASPT